MVVEDSERYVSLAPSNLYWAITFSICVTYATMLNRGVERFVLAIANGKEN